MANYDFVEEEIFIPRGLLATVIHIFTSVLKVVLFLTGLNITVDLHLFWASIIAFCMSMTGSQITHVLFRVKPRNLYLYNLSSLADFVIFLIAPSLAQIFFPEYLAWAIAFVILLFVNKSPGV